MKKSFFLSAILLSSCQMVVDVDMPEHQPVLVGNCILSTDSMIRVNVSKSIGVLNDDQIKPVDSARVELWKDGTSLGVLPEFASGYYGLSWQVLTPSAGSDYRIEISTPGYKTITSSDHIPNPIPIDSVQLTDSILQQGPYNSQDYISEVNISFSDPKTEENYYGIVLLSYNSFSNTYYPLSVHSHDPSLNDESNYGTMLLFSDQYFNGKMYNFKFDFYGAPKFPEDSLVKSDSLFVALLSLSKTTYLYYTTHNLSLQNGFNPFAEPVQVYTNFENGLGIFAGYSSDRKGIK